MRACAALVAGFALLLFAQLGLTLGGSPGGPASPTMAAGDGAILLRHVLVLRDGARPVLAAEAGDRSLAANAPPPKALLPDGAILDRPTGRILLRSAAAGRPNGSPTAAAFEPRGPPAPAA